MTIYTKLFTPSIATVAPLILLKLCSTLRFALAGSYATIGSVSVGSRVVERARGRFILWGQISLYDRQIS